MTGRDPLGDHRGWTRDELIELHHDTIPVKPTRGRAPWEEDVPGPDLAGKLEAGETLTGWASTSGPGTPDPLNPDERDEWFFAIEAACVLQHGPRIRAFYDRQEAL